ncbi:MAG: HTH-type transcriptional activator BauR [Rhodospirillales bacterium]
MNSPPTLALRKLARSDLHLLSVFMTVVERGGFAGAQAALDVSQSTVSRQMTDLEQRLGLRLCQRGRAGYRVTDQGRAVYRACQSLFGALDRFRAEVGAIGGHLIGSLSLAAIENWATDRASPLAAALAALKRQGPALQIELHTLPPDEIERALLEGRVALGLGVFHRQRPGLAYRALYGDPLELFCAPGHPLFDGPVPADLAGADYVRRAYLAEDRVAPLTARLPSSATAHHIEGVAQLILTGCYIGYLPVAYAAPWVGEGRLRSLLPERYRLETTIAVATRKDLSLTLVAETFLALLQREVAAAGPRG